MSKKINSTSKRRKENNILNINEDNPSNCEKLISSPKRLNSSSENNSSSSWSNLPAELHNFLSFNKACEKSKTEKTWLLINIQKEDEFESHQLNWHVWSTETIIEMIKMSFQFWQRYNTHSEAIEFSNLYKVTSYPHISVLDPRTRQKVMQWKPKMFIDPCVAASELLNFIETHSFETPSMPKNVKLTTRSANKNASNYLIPEVPDSTPEEKKNEFPQKPPCDKNMKFNIKPDPPAVESEIEMKPISSYTNTNDLLRDLHRERLARLNNRSN